MLLKALRSGNIFTGLSEIFHIKLMNISSCFPRDFWITSKSSMEKNVHLENANN